MVDMKAYAEQLAQNAALSEDEKKALLQVVANEKVAKAWGDDVLRHQDYSRSMDELRKQQEGLNAEKQDWVAKTTTYYDQLKAWDMQSKQELAKLKATVDTYNSVYGPLEAGQQQVQPSPGNGSTSVTKQDVEQFMGQQYEKLGDTIADLMSLSFEHYQKFGKPLDIRGLAKTAGTMQQQPTSVFRQAYQQMISPEEETRRNAEIETRIQKAREEAARDALSKTQYPAESAPSEASPIRAYMAQKPEAGPVTETERMNRFVNIWQESAQGTKA